MSSQEEKLPIFASASTIIGFNSLNKEFAQHVHILGRKEGPIKSISWNKDGTSIAVVPNSGYVEIGTLNEGGSIKFEKFEAIENPVCAAFPNNTIQEIAIANESGDLKLYNLESRNVKRSFPKSNSIIKQLQYNKTDSHLATACSNGEIIVHDRNTYNIRSFYRIPNCNNVSTIIFHRNENNLLAAGSTSGVVSIWDIKTSRCLFNIKLQHSSITCLEFSPKTSEWLFIASTDTTVKFFDIITGHYIARKEFGYVITAMDFDSSGTYWGVGTNSGRIIIYDFKETDVPIASFLCHKDNRINHLLFQKQLLLVGRDGETSEEEYDSNESYDTLNSIDNVESRDLVSIVRVENPSYEPIALPSTTVTSASTSLQNTRINQSTFDLTNMLREVVKAELETCREKIVEDVQRLIARPHSELHDIKKLLDSNATNLSDD